MESQCIIQPRRLIDFLQDQNLSFPHHRSRKSTISSIIHAAVKSSNILRRRFSMKNRSSHAKEPTMSRTTSVTVKDILRWKSFRDLSEPVEKYIPTSYDFTLESPITRSSSSSEFTVGDSPLWCRGSNSLHINPKGKMIEIQHEEEEEDDDEEQFSPVSVLDYTQQVDLIGRNLMLKQQRVQDFGSVQDHRLVNKNNELDNVESFKIEEKTVQLMDHVKITKSVKECDEIDEFLLLDFFRDELTLNKGMKNNGQFESRVLRMAKSWVGGQDDGSLEWELEGTREVCIREMDKRGKWNDIEDENQEIGIEIEKLVLNHLLDELTMDLLDDVYDDQYI